MIKLRGLILVTVLSFLLTSCPFYGYKYNTGFLPTYPVNLEDFNTQYDDFNLSAPTIGKLFPLFFSSNRNSQGNDYDIVLEYMEIEFDKDDGSLYAGRQINEWYDRYDDNLLRDLLKLINTPANEYGPEITLLEYPVLQGGEYESNQYLALWSTGISGTHNIMVTHNYHRDSAGFLDPVPVKFLNTESDDAYPTVDFINNRIYYCSDTDQEFDIYYCDLPADVFVTESIYDLTPEPEIRLCEVLSSSSHDKCPSITRNIMVFTSDRQGGEGGYDLWYSIMEDKSWSEPVNFGPAINTEHDEYRPVIRYLPDFKHNLLMFSSNRPGGKGGFDLYFVGVKKLINYTN